MQSFHRWTLQWAHLLPSAASLAAGVKRFEAQACVKFLFDSIPATSIFMASTMGSVSLCQPSSLFHPGQELVLEAMAFPTASAGFIHICVSRTGTHLIPGALKFTIRNMLDTSSCSISDFYFRTVSARCYCQAVSSTALWSSTTRIATKSGLP